MERPPAANACWKALHSGQFPLMYWGNLPDCRSSFGSGEVAAGKTGEQQPTRSRSPQGDCEVSVAKRFLKRSRLGTRHPQAQHARSAQATDGSWQQQPKAARAGSRSLPGWQGVPMTGGSGLRSASAHDSRKAQRTNTLRSIHQDRAPQHFSTPPKSIAAAFDHDLWRHSTHGHCPSRVPEETPQQTQASVTAATRRAALP